MAAAIRVLAVLGRTWLPDRSTVADSSPDDVALMQGVASGDAAALRQLYERHAPQVHGVALRMLRDAVEAEQLLIDVFFELWTARARYDQERAQPLTYILRVTRSRALDRLRKRPALGGVALDPAAGMDVAVDDSPGEGAQAAEHQELVASALAELDPEQRRAIECAYFEGLSHTQIAERLKKPLGTVKSQIRLGLERLRGTLRRTLGRERGQT